MMVTLSVGVLQCNPLANVSTVAGKPCLGSLKGSDLHLKPCSGEAQYSPSGLTHSWLQAQLLKTQ